MKAVMLSIRPKWVEKIASGEKTVVVRKTRPKIEAPLKCYIYETQGATETPWVDEDGHFIYKGRGQVIGEFVCDRIEQFAIVEKGVRFKRFTSLYDTCLSLLEMHEYANGKEHLYGWHISDLKVYDKPKELNEFRKPELPTGLRYEDDIITRPPQSYCYVEEVEQ